MSSRNRRRELNDKVLWRSDPHMMVKHLAYRRYVQCWIGKILQTFAHATIVDAFAGPGEYEDKLDGSPMLVAKAYLGHSALRRFGRLHLMCLEDMPARVAHLEGRRDQLPRSAGLYFDIRPPGQFADHRIELCRRAHGGDPGRPVLWILDPFNVASVTMEHLATCLAGPRDEVVLTFFVDEMYRFADKNAGMGQAMTRQFGSDRWRAALGSSESAVKEALVTQFQAGLEDRCGVMARGPCKECDGAVLPRVRDP